MEIYLKIKTVTAVLMLLGVLMFTTCGGSSGGGGDNGADESVVNIAAIPGVVVPVRGAYPVTTSIDTEQYTGTIQWAPADNPFAAKTVYTATIMLTAKTGFTLTGVTADFFTVAGATALNAVNSGTVTAVFPATSAVPDIDVTFTGVTANGTTGTTDSTVLMLNFDFDPATLTADNIYVIGAAKGALTGTGTTRSLAISNITVANGGIVSITITNPAGYAITGSLKTATVYRLLTIGMDYQGGKIAYILRSGDPGYDASVPHGLIAATAALDMGLGFVWYNGSNTTTGARGIKLGTGQANTTAIVSNQGEGMYAAKVCDDYTNTDTGTGAYSDWYLPSQEELNKLYLNRASVGDFSVAFYWSSSENYVDLALGQYFGNGTQYGSSKSTRTRFRAVRSF